MSRSKEPTKLMRDLWEAIGRRPWRFVVPAFLAAALVLAGSLLLPRQYQAEAIFDRRTDMVLAEIANRGASPSFQNPRQSLVEEIAGRPAIDRLIERLGPRLAEQETHTAALAGELHRRVIVRFDVASTELDRVRVSFVAQDPVLAREVVNTLVEGYIERTRAAMEQRLRESAAFFEAEVRRDRALIEQLESRRLTFEISHAELLPENPANVQVALGAAREQLAEVDQKRQAAALREQALRQQLEATAQTTPSLISIKNPELDRLEAKRREFQAQLALYTTTLKMTDRHPDLIDLRAQVAGLEEQIEATPAEVVSQRQVTANPRREELELLLSTTLAERTALDQQYRKLREKIDAMDAQSAQLFPVRSDYRKLTRDLEQHQRQLAFWEDNLRRVRMAVAAESGNRGVQLDFVRPCAPLARPVSPALPQVLLVALALGVLCGLGSVLVAHRSDESFADSQALAEATGLPVLGGVGELITRGQRRLRRLRQAVLFPLGGAALASLLLLLGGLAYLSIEQPRDFQHLVRHPRQYLLDRALRSQASRAPAGDALADAADPEPSRASAVQLAGPVLSR